MERWVRHAALGIDVVPEVNWIFTVSSGERVRGGSGLLSAVSWDIIDAYCVKLL
jgi:hypothetical protein